MVRAMGLLISFWASEALAGSVVINEFMPDPAGTDTGGEWVELLNTTASTVDISGWKLERAKSSWGAVHTFGPGTTLAGGGRLLIGESRVTGAQLSLPDGTLDLGNAGSNADGVRLVDGSGAVRDAVIYGTPNTDNLADDSGAPAASLAPKPASDKSLARTPDGADTDQSGTDVKSVSPATPGAANAGGTGPDPDPVNCAPRVGDVVINEFLPDPDGADNTALAEFVELYNAGVEQSLEGWKLERASKPDNYAAFYTFPAGAVARNRAFVLVGEPNVSGAAHTVPTIALYNGTAGDGVRLVDCAGAVVDTVVYGGTNADLMRDDSGQPATSVAPKPVSGKSIARLRDGEDTDLGAVDFQVPPSNTPGGPNPVPPPCQSDPGDIVINEFLPDPDGADGTALAEFVEIYNAGGSSVSLTGWSIVGASNAADLTPDFTFPEGHTVAPEGFFVVGEANVGGANLTATLLGLPNGTNGDAVKLLDCTGALVDTVIYGENNNDAITDDRGQVGTSIGNPGSSKSMGRVEDGLDSDDVSDWTQLRSPNPGASNVPPEDTDSPDDTGDDPTQVRGCGGGDIEDDPEIGGCTTTSSGGSFGALLLGLAALRRRPGARVRRSA